MSEKLKQISKDVKNNFDKNLLESLGIHDETSKIYPYKHYVEVLNTDINIFPHNTLKDILEKIYNEGIKYGIIMGKKQRSKEFKDLLNNVDL